MNLQEKDCVSLCTFVAEMFDMLDENSSNNDIKEVLDRYHKTTQILDSSKLLDEGDKYVLLSLISSSKIRAVERLYSKEKIAMLLKIDFRLEESLETIETMYDNIKAAISMIDLSKMFDGVALSDEQLKGILIHASFSTSSISSIAFYTDVEQLKEQIEKEYL